jgi:hypothetical protein
MGIASCSAWIGDAGAGGGAAGAGAVLLLPGGKTPGGGALGGMIVVLSPPLGTPLGIDPLGSGAAGAGASARALGSGVDAAGAGTAEAIIEEGAEPPIGPAAGGTAAPSVGAEDAMTDAGTTLVGADPLGNEASVGAAAEAITEPAVASAGAGCTAEGAEGGEFCRLMKRNRFALLPATTTGGVLELPFPPTPAQLIPQPLKGFQVVHGMSLGGAEAGTCVLPPLLPPVFPFPLPAPLF